MSAQSTVYITREDAIDRIKEIATLLIEKDYLGIEVASFEDHIDSLGFVDNWTPIDTSDVGNWTDKMLEDYMDHPFFRHSMFNNYLIRGG